MGTYVSILNWTQQPRPTATDLRAAILRHDATLRRRGLHSIVLLPDRGECMAVIIAAVRDARDIEPLATSILPGVPITIESLLFDDGTVAPPPPRPACIERAYLDSVLEAVIAG